jgi:predicted ATP-dependent endonuclease of OLD family
VDGYTGTIWITITNESGTINHSLDYAGSGLYELGYLLFLLLIKKDILILDEPALNLHPIWQKEISKLIEEYCSIGQSIVITHSPYILPDFTKENIIDYIIYHFSLDSQDHSTVNSIINLKKEHLLNTMKYRKMIDKFKTIFFADIVIVVEGESDERLIQEIINEKFIHEQKNLKNIDVINTGGGNDPVKLFKLLKSWSIPVLLIVDNDKEMDLDKEGLSNLPTILLLHSDLEGTIVIGDLLDIIFRFKDASKISIKSEIKKFGKDNNHYRVLEILKSVDTILKESSLDDKDIQEVIKKLVNNPEMIPKSEWDRMNVELNRDKNRISEKISYFIDRKYFEIESKIERIIEILNDENNPILTYCPQQILDFI